MMASQLPSELMSSTMRWPTANSAAPLSAMATQICRTKSCSHDPKQTISHKAGVTLAIHKGVETLHALVMKLQQQLGEPATQCCWRN